MNKGLYKYKLPSNYKMSSPPTAEQISKFFAELRKGMDENPKHFNWEENGETYSAWKFDVGNRTIYTGDAGAAQIMEEIKKQANGK